MRGAMLETVHEEQEDMEHEDASGARRHNANQNVCIFDDEGLSDEEMEDVCHLETADASDVMPNDTEAGDERYYCRSGEDPEQVAFNRYTF
ncbi:hypothetical protein CYMTET_51811 [Cymbomonas tetramitiformis]|uniref:Uncharacterized protein n=1 Tax=Cymbomonas tetramitiformis TaxID=36881 RepID=A0AAE0ESA1_9CHLO|nr:hypothetical protein CYMTET_51811 [Cymbomonas tetramitiformis]